MSTITLNTKHAASIERNISEHRLWYYFQGIVFVAAGLFAMILPVATAIGLNYVIGALLLVSGVVQCFAGFRSGVHWWSLISGFLSVIAGGLLLFAPLAGVIALTTLLAIFLVLEGVTEVFLSLEFRPAKNWGWLLASGIVSLALAAILFIGLPGFSAMLLGLFVGVNLLLYGISLIALTAALKK